MLKNSIETTVEMDESLAAVASFMQATLPAAKLVSVAEALRALAPLLWGSYDREEIRPLALSQAPSPCKPAAASG